MLAQATPNAADRLRCMAASLTGWIVSSVFGDYLNDEWGFWSGGCHLCLSARPYGSPELQKP